MNLSTALIGLAVLAVLLAILVGGFKKRKNECSGCSCGCPNAAACRGEATPPKTRP